MKVALIAADGRQVNPEGASRRPIGLPWNRQNGDSLCWYCSNAYGGCSWSGRSKEPVDGWDAFRIDVLSQVYQMGTMKPRKIESYIVVDFPKFDLDDRFAEEFSAWSKRKAIVLAKKKRREQTEHKKAARRKCARRTKNPR